MWRDDRVITAKGSGLRLVSYCVPGSSHRPPPDSRGRSASADGLTTAIRPAEGKKGRLCHVLELDFQCPIQGGACIDPHGFDAGKLIKGKKRHVLVDTLGLILHGIVTSASVQDRDGGIMLLSTLFGMFPFLEKLFADSAYEGPIFHTALAKIRPLLKTEIVKRSDKATGFVVLPKRWIVERSIAWLNRCRRLAKDWENLILSAVIFLRLASIRLMLRKLCNPA